MTDSEFRYLVETHRITLSAASHGWEARVAVVEAPNLIRYEIREGRTAVAAVTALAEAMSWLAVTNLPLFQVEKKELI